MKNVELVRFQPFRSDWMPVASTEGALNARSLVPPGLHLSPLQLKEAHQWVSCAAPSVMFFTFNSVKKSARSKAFEWEQIVSSVWKEEDYLCSWWIAIVNIDHMRATDIAWFP